MTVQQMALTVTAETESIGVVRHFVVAALPLLGADGYDQDAIALLTSELIANAVDLRAGSVVVSVTRAADRVRVEVRDRGYGRPEVRRPGSADLDGGRGLLVVDQLATAWGVDQFLPGKIVWFEVASPASTPHGATTATAGTGATQHQADRPASSS